MTMNVSRKERRVLEAENRARPEKLSQIPAVQWRHISVGAGNRIEVWRSRSFLVQIFSEKTGERLTVCRTVVKDDDWVSDISWDDLQRLKRECGRGNRDAVEVYPADSDLVNAANMRHLWLIGDLPFKWKAAK